MVYLLATYWASAFAAPTRSSLAQPVLFLRGPSLITQTARSRSVPSGLRFSGRSHRRSGWVGRDIGLSNPRSTQAWYEVSRVAVHAAIGLAWLLCVSRSPLSSHRETPTSRPSQGAAAYRVEHYLAVAAACASGSLFAGGVIDEGELKDLPNRVGPRAEVLMV